MRFFSRSSLVAIFALSIGVPAAGCSAVTEDTASDEAAISATLHEPQGDERKAIYDAFRVQLNQDLHGQAVIFNHKDPPGRYLAHGDWAFFEGILEGPNGNTTPIDYRNSAFAQDFEDGFLAGVQRNGQFAAKFQAVAHRENGAWAIAKVQFGADASPTFVVGSQWSTWESWTSVPPPGFRDIFAAFPVDDLHEPQGDERSAILGALRGQLGQDLHGQNLSLNHKDPPGTFLAHDGWAFFSGIIEGPNGNTTPINYANSVYAQASSGAAFKGVLRNGNFAANVRALLKKNADGSWTISATQKEDFSTPGYTVGTENWVGDPASQFAWDIFGGSGNGNGEGDGEGDGEGEGG